MKRVLKYLAILIIAACFLQAALEVNAGPVQNIFDDEYDVYIHPDNSSSIPVLKIEQSHDFATLPEHNFHYGPAFFPHPVSDSGKNKITCTSQYRLYIYHHSLLI